MTTDELTAEQKAAKHDSSLHQDGLFWSRTQFLLAIHSGVVAGLYYLGRDGEPWAAGGLFGLGLGFTVLILLLMRRDWRLGEKAFRQSGMPETLVDEPWWGKGRWLNWIAIALLFVAELTVVLYFVFFR